MQPSSQPARVDSSAEVSRHSSGQPMTSARLESWLRLQAIDGVGDLTVLRLVRAWHSPEAVLDASRDELIQRGCSLELADAIRRGPDGSSCRSLEQEIRAIERGRIEVRSVLDPTYPARLKMIADPPPLLYITGTLTEQDELAIAIVGARRATAAGRVMTEELSHDLAAAGMTVVSGLARGVDRPPTVARLPRRGAPLPSLAAESIGSILRNMIDCADRLRNAGPSCPRLRWARLPTATTFHGEIVSSAACPWG